MLFTKREEGREGGREGTQRQISLEKSDNGIIRQNTDVEIQVPQGGPISPPFSAEASYIYAMLVFAPPLYLLYW